jgi:hypothetical protein
MGDSVPKHMGPISLTDTHPRTEHLQNPTGHHSRDPRDGEACSSEMLNLLADATVGRRTPLLSSRWLN